MSKIKVYVSSFKGVSTLDYVDTKSMGHPCVTSRHGENIFSQFKHLPEGTLEGYLTENQIKVLDAVSEFCREHRLEYEVIDITSLNFAGKMKLVIKGIKAPTVSFEGKRIEGVLAEEDLKALITK